MRIKIKYNTPFLFSTKIPVRISDINYGGHVGNDSFLSILHEARLQFLHSLNYTEMNIENASIIMADSALQYKAEAFYGDVLTIEISIDNFTEISFEIYYKITKQKESEMIDVLYAKTGMVMYDYKDKKVISVPNKFREKILKISV